jgi:drug/metabolite transporter (DMT)-like permease
VLPVSLALLAALLFAIGASLQQQVGRASLPVAARPNVPVRRLHAWLPITAALGNLVRHPVWLAGWGVNAVGFTIQAVALHTGSVALVQPVMVTQLLFTVPIAVWHTRRRPSGVAVASGVAMFAGVSLFIAKWGTGTPPGGSTDWTRVLGAVLTALGLAACLVTVSARLGRPARAALEAIAAGLCFAVSAALIKLTVDSVVRYGIGTAAAQWPAYLLVVSTVLGLLISQDALATGHLSTTVAGMSITNPVASTVIGLYAFRERVPITAGELAGLICAGLLIVAGVIGMARSASALAGRRGADDDVAAPRDSSTRNWVAGLTPGR